MLWRTLLAASLAGAVILAAIALDSASSQARSRPKCAGRPATQVSHKSHIVAKPHAAVVALGKRDHKITVFKNDRTNHIICGGPGNDEIDGGRGDDVLVGGSGKDTIKGGPGQNLIVGDNYNRHGNAIGHVGRDRLIGGRGREVIIGDNLASRGARGATPDRIESKAGNDTIVGDSAVTGCGKARGGGADKIGAAQGDDLTIGDSYSRCGNAIGGGNNTINDGPGADLDVGNAATVTGKAKGGGNNTIHGADGGDTNAKCAPRACDDRLYGDSYAFSQRGTYHGTGNSLLAGDQGDNYLDGMGSKPGGGGRGKTLCAGNRTGHNTAIHCAVYKDIQKVLKRPEPPPPLTKYGAPWPGRQSSPQP